MHTSPSRHISSSHVQPSSPGVQPVDAPPSPEVELLSSVTPLDDAVPGSSVVLLEPGSAVELLVDTPVVVIPVVVTGAPLEELPATSPELPSSPPMSDSPPHAARRTPRTPSQPANRIPSFIAEALGAVCGIRGLAPQEQGRRGRPASPPRSRRVAEGRDARTRVRRGGVSRRRRARLSHPGRDTTGVRLGRRPTVTARSATVDVPRTSACGARAASRAPGTRAPRGPQRRQRGTGARRRGSCCRPAAPRRV